MDITSFNILKFGKKFNTHVSYMDHKVQYLIIDLINKKLNLHSNHMSQNKTTRMHRKTKKKNFSDVPWWWFGTVGSGESVMQKPPSYATVDFGGWVASGVAVRWRLGP